MEIRGYYAGIAMRVEILGQERRRRWRDDEKLTIVMSVGDGGATITEVAHQHDITRQQIYAWRSELKKKGLLSASSSALFIPVDMKAVRMRRPRPIDFSVDLRAVK